MKYILAVIAVFGYWLWSTLKKLYRRANGESERVPDVNLLKKITPLVRKEGGWKVKTVYNGVPLWSYGTTFTFAPNNLVATATNIKARPQEILNQLTRPDILATVFPDFPAFHISKKQSDGDLLELTKDMYTILSIPNILLALKQMEYTFTRKWVSNPEYCWMCVYPTVEVLTSYYGYWFCFLIQDAESKDGDCSSLVHILASFPTNFTADIINQKMTSCHVLLKMHMKSSIKQKSYTRLVPDDPALKKRTSVADKKLPSEKNGADTSSISSGGSVTISLPVTKVGRGQTYTVVKKAEPRAKKEKEESQKLTAPAPTEKVYPKLVPYLTVIKAGFDDLLSIWEATEDTEGWDLFNKTNGVVVHKKASVGGTGHDIYKGTTTIAVPLPYLMQYLNDLQNKKEYDDMFEDGKILEDLDDSMTQIFQLVLRNLFIVTGRDFVSISATRHIRDNLYGTMVRATPHASCPPMKSKVRGEVIIGGYVYKEISKEPPMVEIMYAVCTNPNGSIPQKVVNKVSSEQPLSLAIVRRKVEERFKKGERNDGEEFIRKLKTLPSMLPNTETTSELTDDCESVFDITESSEALASDGNDENESGHQYNQEIKRNKNRSASTVIPVEEEYILSEGDILEYEDEEDETTTESEELVGVSPRSFIQEGDPDLEKIAQKCIADMEEELNLAKTVETNMKMAYTRNDKWTYRGVQKDVTLMKKVSSQRNVHSFLGTGIIELPPDQLWELVKDPTTRQVYDTMLKTNQVLKELDDRRKIMYMRYETHACLLKQARDFCVMTVDSVNEQRYAHTACSVEIPECPVRGDCVRGRIHSSGWIIEPQVQNGKTVSLVTYITQIDFGGFLPKPLMNFISKRQPLVIAYLRNHIENPKKKYSSSVSSSIGSVSS